RRNVTEIARLVYVAVMMENTAMAGMKYVETLTRSPSVFVVPLKIAVKITRNISGNAKVKNAAGGLRQNARFVNFTCRSVSAVSLNVVSPVASQPASAPAPRPRRRDGRLP